MYDLIGDIHGERKTLEALLVSLEFRHGVSGWSHPGRKAIFLGDFIDRGADSAGVCRIVREMVESGAALAVMGNHEINALAFHTADSHASGNYLRPHEPKNIEQHRAALDSFEDCEGELADTLDWFRTLPLWLDLDELRVVHAAWHEESMQVLSEFLDNGHRLLPGSLTPLHKESEPFEAMEILLKGVEVSLPNGIGFYDKGGIWRTAARIRWWQDDLARPWPEVVLGSRALREQLPPRIAEVEGSYGYAESDVPVFIGHYWLTGIPEVLAPNVACVDYSVARPGGQLVAYRWDGEAQLRNDSFRAVPRLP